MITIQMQNTTFTDAEQVPVSGSISITPNSVWDYTNAGVVETVVDVVNTYNVVNGKIADSAGVPVDIQLLPTSGTGISVTDAAYDVTFSFGSTAWREVWDIPDTPTTIEISDITKLSTTAVATLPIAGPAGSTGPAGAQGPQGTQGTAGATGATGPAGATGAAGADGISVDHVTRTLGNGAQGTTDTYTVWGDVSETISMRTFTVYNGADGATGATGPAGATGAAGAQGPQGPQGVAGGSMNWLGAWVSTTTYAADDAISSGGRSFISLQAGNLNHTPPATGTSDAWWGLAADKGADGATGSTGATGPQGPQGTAGAAGATGATGATGPQGAAGATGAAGTSVDHVSKTAGTGAPGTTDTYTVWGDAGETINMSTFTVYNGADGGVGTGYTWVVKAAAYTAVDGDGIFADTSAGAFPVTLPLAPSTNAKVAFNDSAGTWSTANLTVARNGQTIMGLAQDLIADQQNGSFELIFNGTDWRLF